jgi:hypothetical protein
MADGETGVGGRDGRRRSKRKASARTANGKAIPLATAFEQQAARQKEAQAMPEQDSGNVRLFSDFADSVLGALRSVAARYIDATESIAKQMLNFQAQTTAWAKETPMAAIFESQYSFGHGLVEFWAGSARALWRIEEPKPEK